MRHQRLIPSLLLGTVLCIAQTAALAVTSVKTSAPGVRALSEPEGPPAGMPQHGQGRYGRYLQLQTPMREGFEIAPNTPYRLFLTGQGRKILRTPRQDGIVHGVTDARGRTAWIWTDDNDAPDAFTLLRRVGDAPWGTFYQLNASADGQALPQWPYVISLHTRWGPQWLDIGYTNQDGSTAYVSDALPAGSTSVSTDARVTYDRSCFDRLNKAYGSMIRNDAAQVRDALAQLPCADTLQDRLDVANLLLMVDRKALARDYVDQTRGWRFFLPGQTPAMAALQHRLEIEKLLGRPKEALADARLLQQRQAKLGGKGDTDWANNIAYFLADFDAYLPEAEQQARQSLRHVGKRPYNQGTLGWIQYRRGDIQAGLENMQQAYRNLPRDEEMVADLGLALWHSRQEARAWQLWKRAQTQCVWGRRLHDAMLEASYPHPLFQHPGSASVTAYRARCDAPSTKAKRVTLS